MRCIAARGVAAFALSESSSSLEELAVAGELLITTEGIMKIRSVRSIASRERFEHEAANVVIEIDGIEYTITENRERAGRVLIRASVARTNPMLTMSITPHGDGFDLGVDVLAAELIECDECGRLSSSVHCVRGPMPEAEKRYLCSECR